MLKLLQHWKKLNLPWRKEKYMGSDLEGNLYFQSPPIGSTYKPKRFVVWENKKHEYTPNSIDVLWSAWLRHTRPTPPTLDELNEDVRRRTELKKRVELLEQRDKNESRVLDGPTGTGEHYVPGAWKPNK